MPKTSASCPTRLCELQAECIAVPPFDESYLRRGHAVHFRCLHPEVYGMRLDVMSRMRGVAPFEELWPRRTTLEDPSGSQIELMALADLVQAKKTQRDKDWSMLRRLVEAHYVSRRGDPTNEQIAFWLLQSRTAAMLMEVLLAIPVPSGSPSCRAPVAVSGRRRRGATTCAGPRCRGERATRGGSSLLATSAVGIRADSTSSLTGAAIVCRGNFPSVSADASIAADFLATSRKPALTPPEKSPILAASRAGDSRLLGTIQRTRKTTIHVDGSALGRLATTGFLRTAKRLSLAWM